MGLVDVLSLKSGVIVGDDVLRLFEYAREKQFAVPAIVRVLPRPDSSAPGPQIREDIS